MLQTLKYVCIKKGWNVQENYEIELPLSSLYISIFSDFRIWFSISFPFVSGTSDAEMAESSIKAPPRKYIRPETDLLWNKQYQ